MSGAKSTASNIALVGLVAFGAISCGSAGSNVEYHTNGGQTVTIDDGKNGQINAEIGATATMPKDLPSWAGMYPGSTIMVSQTHSVTPGAASTENVTMQTADDLAKVTAFYDGKLAQAGLKSVHSVSDAQAATRMVQTKGGIVSIGVVKNDEGGSLISISRLPNG